MHLNVRTQYSPLQSLIRIETYLDELVHRQLGRAIICETTLTGVPAFIEACQRRQLQPVIGWEQRIEEEDCCILWFAFSSDGLRQLYRLASEQPVIEASSLIAVLVPLRQASEDMTRLRRSVVQWMGHVQGARTYMGVTSSRSTVERESRMRYREVAASLGVETIPVDPVRYLHRAEAPAYQAIRAIREATTFQDQKTDRLMHLKTREELLEDFTEREITMAEQFAATSERLELPFQQRPLPRVAEDSNAMLRTHAEEGLLAHGHESKEAAERLAYELSVIEQTGFADYFLIVEELIRRAKAKGIHVGPGRGSAAGSLVSYALGITTVDPLKYGLLFERFLNPERISMPDIDIDIEDERREEVLEDLVMRYGKDHVAQIGTLSTLGAKAALRDVGRAREF